MIRIFFHLKEIKPYEGRIPETNDEYLPKKSMLRLMPKRWLNDEIINGFFYYFKIMMINYAQIFFKKDYKVYL